VEKTVERTRNSLVNAVGVQNTTPPLVQWRERVELLEQQKEVVNSPDEIKRYINALLKEKEDFLKKVNQGGKEMF